MTAWAEFIHRLRQGFLGKLEGKFNLHDSLVDFRHTARPVQFAPDTIKKIITSAMPYICAGIYNDVL
jgi:hypothetical protein